jgi:hypothetical protein
MTEMDQGTGRIPSTAVQDARDAFHSTLSRRLAERSAAEREAAQHAIKQYLHSPEPWYEIVAIHLREAAVDRDETIRDLAAQLLRLTDPTGTRAGKYAIAVNGGQGVIVGEHNQQYNNTYNALYSYEDIKRRFKISWDDPRYTIFWDEKNEGHRASLLDDAETYAHAVTAIQQRILSDEGTHVGQCVSFIREIDGALAARALADLEEVPRNRLSAAIAACLAAEETLSRWCRDLLGNLHPERSAYLVQVAASLGKSPGHFLNAITTDQATAIVVASNAEGAWLPCVSKDRRGLVLAAAAKIDAARLAALLIEVPAAQAGRLLGELADDKSATLDDFRAVTDQLPPWHLVVLAARATLPGDYLESLLPRLRKTIQASPSMTPVAAVFGVRPIRYEASRIAAVASILYWVWKAEADWIPGLRDQRDHALDVIMTIIAILALIVIAVVLYTLL